MVLQPDNPRTKLELKRYAAERGFAYDGQPRAPLTPSEWFSQKFPRQAKIHGCPFIEAREQVSGVLVKVTPVGINHDFFGAVLGGDDLIGPKVIFFEPDLTFYFQDRDGVFKPTSEQKLENLLRAYLMRCAEELPGNVEKLNLFLEFRSDANVRTVIKRAKSILAAEHTFFSVDSNNARQKGPELDERLARQFVQHALTREPTMILTVTDAFSCYTQFLKSKDISPPRRELFKGLLAPIVRDEFDLGLRNDLPGSDNKQKAGWKGLKPVGGRQAVMT